MANISQEHAQAICEDFDLFDMMENEEETILLREHNPGSYEAYKALVNIAMGVTQ